MLSDECPNANDKGIGQVSMHCTAPKQHASKLYYVYCRGLHSSCLIKSKHQEKQHKRRCTSNATKSLIYDAISQYKKPDDHNMI